jgi:hypothetical protein
MLATKVAGDDIVEVCEMCFAVLGVCVRGLCGQQLPDVVSHLASKDLCGIEVHIVCKAHPLQSV